MRRGERRSGERGGVDPARAAKVLSSGFCVSRASSLDYLQALGRTGMPALVEMPAPTAEMTCDDSASDTATWASASSVQSLVEAKSSSSSVSIDPASVWMASKMSERGKQQVASPDGGLSAVKMAGLAVRAQGAGESMHANAKQKNTSHNRCGEPSFVLLTSQTSPASTFATRQSTGCLPRPRRPTLPTRSRCLRRCWRRHRRSRRDWPAGRAGTLLPRRRRRDPCVAAVVSEYERVDCL